jgi:hypothetical protein
MRKKGSTCVITMGLVLSFLILTIGLTVMSFSPILVYSICEYNIGRRDLFLQSNYDIRLMAFEVEKVKLTLQDKGKSHPKDSSNAQESIMLILLGDYSSLMQIFTTRVMVNLKARSVLRTI